MSAHGSPLRLLAGAVMIIVAATMALVGFVRLMDVLDGGGYGTSAMRLALVVMGIAGALFAAGTATVIWDIAQRYETGGRDGSGGARR